MRIVLGFLALLAVTSTARATEYDNRLDALVAGEETGVALAGASLAVMVGDAIVYTGAAGCAAFKDDAAQSCVRAMKPETKVRVASVSKMAAAMAARRLVEEGRLDLDRDVSDYLGWRLRNPAFPDAPITARQLGAHLSSIRDPEEYWVAAPGKFRTLFDGEAPPFADDAPGASRAPGGYFTYANLNYGVLAAVMEKAAGARFDEIVTDRVLAPLGLGAGYNWSGVSRKARRNAASLYRWESGRWMAQVDDAEMRDARGPYFLKQDGLDGAAYLAAYEPGDNATLFSPQGGLRASVIDLVKLNAARADTPPLWRYDPETENGDTEEGFYRIFGFGVQTVTGDDDLLAGRTITGHSGEAYGLHSGAWRLAAKPGEGVAAPVNIAFAVTGVQGAPRRGANPTFNVVEEQLMRIAFDAAGVAADAPLKPKEEPRPFDEARDAGDDVDMALGVAKARGVNALLVLGGNWCHDSRGLAAKFETPQLQSLIAENYELVWVDIGHRDRNLDIARRFGVNELLGTPTVLIVSPTGKLLNADTVHDWRNAASRSEEETRAYFRQWSDRDGG